MEPRGSIRRRQRQLWFVVDMERLETGGARAERGGRAARLLLGTAQPVLWGSLLLTSPSHRFLPLRHAVHARAPRLGTLGRATPLSLPVATTLGFCCCCELWTTGFASAVFRRFAGGYSVDMLGEAIAVVVQVRGAGGGSPSRAASRKTFGQSTEQLNNSATD